MLIALYVFCYILSIRFYEGARLICCISIRISIILLIRVYSRQLNQNEVYYSKYCCTIRYNFAAKIIEFY